MDEYTRAWDIWLKIDAIDDAIKERESIKSTSQAELDSRDRALRSMWDERAQLVADLGGASRAAMLTTAPVAAGSASNPPASEPRPDVLGPKFSMTKAGLVAAHKHEWPTIQSDMKDASANGLASAKAGPRGWHEITAMEWARAKGKLIDASTPAVTLTQGVSSMVDLPGRKHMQKR